MIRALAIVMLLGAFVQAPPGWREDTEQATALATKTSALQHFGNAKGAATAQVFVPADGPGALYVIAVVGKITEHRDEAARVEVDSFLGSPKRAQLVSPKIAIAQSGSSADTTRRQLEASLTWQDPDAGSETHARLVIAADAEQVVAVTGECVFGQDTTAATRTACTTALASLDTGIPADKRIALALAPEGSEPPPVVTAPTMSASGSGSGSSSSLSEGPRAALPPINIATEPKRVTDRRPVYVGLGIVVLAAVFWWNRRRRERLEKETDE